MEQYADFAGEAIAAYLRALDDNGPAGAGAGRGSHERGPLRETSSAEDTVSHFAGDIANRLFSVGLSLDSAHSIARMRPDSLVRAVTATVAAARAAPGGFPDRRLWPLVRRPR